MDMNFTTALKEQGLALITIEITGSDFQKSLKGHDMGLEKELERELGNMGRKKVLGSLYPKQLRNNRDQTYAHMNKMGVRFGTFGCWAVPVDIYNDVHQFLKDKKQEREDIKKSLLLNYEKEVRAFAEQAEEIRPGFGQIVLQNALPKSHIDNQIQFSIEAQDQIVSGVALNSIKTLSRMAKDYEDKLLKKARDDGRRPNITRFTKNVLTEMQEYCYRFLFLSDVLGKAADLISDTIATLPSVIVSGVEYPNETTKVFTALKLLRTPDELDGIIVTNSVPPQLATSPAVTIDNDSDDSEFMDVDDLQENLSIANDEPIEASQLALGGEEFEEFEEFEPNAVITEQQEVSIFDFLN